MPGKSEFSLPAVRHLKQWSTPMRPQPWNSTVVWQFSQPDSSTTSRGSMVVASPTSTSTQAEPASRARLQSSSHGVV